MLARLLYSLRNVIYYDLFGPKIVPMRYFVNLFKGLTFVWILSLMWYFHNYSASMYLYLFLHGTYGIFWLFKDLTYPDESFKKMASLGSLILVNILLILYWMMPLLIASGQAIQEPTTRRITFCVISYLVGVFLMLGADIQKTATLSKRKGNFILM